MPRVLVVEDEGVLRASMARGLRKLAGVEVSEAGTLAEALVELDARPPELVVSDIDLPDRSGLEVLGELGRRGLKVPVLFVSAYLKAYGPAIPQHADVEVREKPISLDELRELVLKKLQGHGKPRRGTSPFTVADFVQLACIGRHSVAIELDDGGRPAGRVIVLSGEVWSAEDEGGGGEDAFRRVVFARRGRIQCRTFSEEPGARNVWGDWRLLLMESARLEDESHRPNDLETAIELGEPFPAPEPVTQPVEIPEAAARMEPPEPAARAFDADAEFERAWEEGVAALLSKSYPAAHRAFRRAQEIRPSDWRVEKNLSRLRSLGVPLDDEGPA